MKKRLFTGLQPSGALHIGNYFGALKPFKDIAGDYDSFLMIADYHSLTTMRDATTLRSNIIDVVKDYIAIGVEPDEVTIFKQSDVPEHTELAWIFECLVTVPFLSQAHAYKDKVAKGLEANAGLFNYPMLMAADILLYDADVVPVGEDQRQHVEYAREAATKFNNAYGETFVPPQEMVLKGVGIVAGTDGQKMSKSYKNTIPLFGTKDEISRAVMSVVTDSSGDRPENVYSIHRLFRTESELEGLYAEHAGKYKDLKEALIEDIETLVAPMREKRSEITDDDVRTILKNGSEKAQAQAQKKITEIRDRIGVSI
ncbi:MAG: tryptophan--tRNA ligase [Candidatus Pacebacteria bacterium]|nr:tryptophan--tRNA ligase [Candidatus Paceibacterota bacterium]MCF7857092.1 tryptophan--tRNA ligase [Candidatus Paceibacterota bacterium]